eukprot:CAMPEP_0204623810 /NCGR_PEP_ID=MMETSP0717-20131115/9571_1 /ASSEMBLY_ACC=CAM_ASM_000666 /TAXON_ID=230516 /ORGANISM="Chaetoceros curvisetus" /LENGTH=117 /DNA_ID=CAMNT_0051639009 /DNA_START=61 /DNA_END=412 /DNA_ORIENTATION=+
MHLHSLRVDNWVTVSQSLYGENSFNWFGASVSISLSGSRIAVSGYGNDVNGLVAGHVMVFDFDEDSDQWNQIDKDIDSESAHDYSGFSVASSNDANFCFAVRAAAFRYDNGSAHVYE